MAAVAPPSTALTAAEESLVVVQRAPEAGRQAAAVAARRAREVHDREAETVAERALAIAAMELNSSADALRHIERSLRVADAAGLTRRAAEARMTLSFVLAARGDTSRALLESARAAPHLRGPDAARLWSQRALVLQRSGRNDEALRAYRRALPVLRRSADQLWLARTLCNRAVLHAYRGALGAAERDLEEAAGACDAIGATFLRASVQHNLGFVLSRRGAVPEAMEQYDGAEARYLDVDAQVAPLLLDRAELLLSVRLVKEAKGAAAAAAEELSRGGMDADLAEARLMLAHAALMDRDPEVARSAADDAARLFGRQRRAPWRTLARFASLQARWQAGERSPGLLRTARAAAVELEATGWPVAALDARLMGARIALDRGRLDVAAAELTAASRARRHGPVDVRARAWHAEALLRLAQGNRRGAYAATRAGLGTLQGHQATLGATELRAQSSTRGVELACFGLELALEDRNARRVLLWAERFRASTLRLRPVRPPDDRELTADLTELRRTVGELQEASLGGAPAGGLLRRQAALEEQIRRRALRTPGGRREAAAGGPHVRDLGAALGDRALLEIVESDGRLHAVVVADGKARLRSLGLAAGVESELEALRFALRRLARRHGSPASLTAASHSAAHSARCLQELLLDPLVAELDDRPLVIVPTGELHAVPWALLPALRGRPVTVAPSATAWLRAAQRPERAGTVVLVVGPGLDGAAAEIDDLAARHPRAVCLSGPHATAEATLAAIDGADLVHVAAHGTFRSDNPLFSNLQLADGPLTVYDLERLRRAPRRLILSACDTGLSAVRPGDELMGLATALFALGTQTLIGSVVPVPDADTHRLMLAVHDGLQAGASPARALADAQAAEDDRDDTNVASYAGFVCFGAG